MGTGHSKDLNSKSIGCKICALNPSFKAPYLISAGRGRGRGKQESFAVDGYLGFLSFAWESIINDLYDPSLNAS